MFVAPRSTTGEIVSVGVDFPAAVDEVGLLLRCFDGIEHDGEIAAGRVLHTGRYGHAADGHAVMLVLNGTCANRDVGKQIVDIAIVFRIKHLIGAGQAGLLDGVCMELSHRDDACEYIRLLFRIRLMDETLVALSGRARLVCIDTRDQKDPVADLVLYLRKAVDVIEYRVDIVCRAGADDQNKFIRCAGKDVADFRVTFFLDFYDPVRERVHFFHFRRNRKLFYKIHSHCTVFFSVKILLL